jgi:O-antigen/teichoic acid export membrane protein
MAERPPAYAAGVAAVVARTAAGALAGFVSLWLLSRILSKPDFGAYAVAMNVVLLLAIVATLGLDRVLLVRIAALAPRRGVLKGGGLALRVGGVCAVAGLAVAAALWALAGRAAAWGAAPEAGFWLAALAPAVVPLALTTVLQAWFMANHRVPEAVVMPSITDIGRAALLACVLAAGAGPAAVAAAAVVAACLPAAMVLAGRATPRRRAPRRLRWADLRAGALYMVQTLANTGTRYVDLLVLGFAAAATVAADYAVAARLAALCEMGRLSLKPTFTPRVRRQLHVEDHATLGREFHALRLGGFVFAAVAAGGFAALGRPILALFGAYGSAYEPLLVLTAAHVLTAGAGMHASYLAMSGELRWSAAIRVAALAVLVAGIAAAAPRLGALGAALAFLAAQAFANLASLVLLRLRSGFVAVPALPAVLVALAVAVPVAAALGVLSPAASGLSLGGLAGAAVTAERPVWRDLRGLLRRRGGGAA